jgi:hypothetical protein
MMIEIRSNFTDWHEVTERQAMLYAKWLLESTPRISKEKKIEYIKTKVKGIDLDYETIKNYDN